MMSAPSYKDEFRTLITHNARLNAKTFSAKQPTPQKACQVYENTLAVSVIYAYLKILSIQSYPSASDSWNPLMQVSGNVADLVTDRGKLECRSVRPGETHCSVPLEGQGDRTAYFVVRLDDDNTATILGFSQKIQGEILRLEQLHPLSEFPLCWARLQPVIDLRLWLDSSYPQDWRFPEELLTPSQAALSNTTATIQRAKGLSLTLGSGSQAIILLLSITVRPNGLSIQPQLYPAISAPVQPTSVRLIYSSANCLKAGIELILLSSNEESVADAENSNILPREREMKKAISRTYPQDNCLRIPTFLAEWGEYFCLRIQAEGQTITENFRI